MTAALGRILLLLLAGAACILIAAVPMRPGVPEWPVPDLLMLLCCYWVLRRPESTPLLAVFALGLAADLVLLRPVGVGALTLVLATEVLRAQRQGLGDTSFLVEWLIVALTVLVMATLQIALLWLGLGALPALGEVAAHAGLTAAVYPLMAFVCATLLGLRHRRGGRLSYSSYLGEG